MARASAACRRLRTIPGVGQLTALAFVAAIRDPSRIRRSRDIGAYLGLVPRQYQSGRSITLAAYPNAGTGGCERFSMRPPIMLTRYKASPNSRGAGVEPDHR